MKKITVIIVTYNSQKDIYDCLEALYRCNDIGDQLEVIVVDNHSKGAEAMFGRISREYPGVLLISNPENLGYGHGNNIGIRNAHAPYMVIMNPDVRLVEPIFAALWAAFEQKQADLIGMRQCERADRPGQSFLMLYPSCFNLFLHKFCTRTDLFLKRKFCFSGACFAFRKESLEAIGLFDEKIFLYGEERYIHLQLLKMGRSRIYYHPEWRYIHPVHERAFSEREVRQGLRSYQYTLRKMGLNCNKRLRKFRNMYRLLYVCSLFAGHRNEADHYKKVVKIINENNR